MKAKFIVVPALTLAIAAGNAATHTVITTADTGPGTLRQAILDANAIALPETVFIQFNIPGSGVQTIAPLSALPIITRPVTIDGYTQPGTSSNTLQNANNAVLRVELSGTNLTSDYGLRINANDCTIRGLVINGFSAQVLFESATNGVVEGNFLGTEPAGATTNIVVGVNGVLISGGAGHRIGGLNLGSRNLISGNSYVGINVVGPCVGLQVLGNFIGITGDGLSVLPSGWGMYLSGCSQAQIGGSAPGARNVLAGHSTGCWLTGGESNVIQGNFFGTDASGTLRRTNSYYGLAVQQTPNNLIGGGAAGAGNLFSGNGTGIYLDGVGASNNVIAGNLIGPDISGTNVLGNGFYGVAIVGAPNNTVGGFTPGARNVICGNDYAGVALSNPTATGNFIQGNYIGVDVTGTNALSSSGVGVAIYDAPGNLIGGTSPGARNVIARNFHGILTTGSNNVIQGNFIGTDATGTKRLGNDEHGIVQSDNAPGTIIGGAIPGAGNLISANGYDGISIGSPGTIVQGNIIGADVSGTNALFNGWSGIEIGNSAPFTQVGGTNAAARNVISGNSSISVDSSNNVIQGNYVGIGTDGRTIVGEPSFGITLNALAIGNLLGGDTLGAGNIFSGQFGDGIRVVGSNNVIQGNLIGTDASGTLPRGNNGRGVLIWGQNNLVGGLTTGARNLISANNSGLVLTANTATGNTIQGNFIGTDVTGINALGNLNTGLGIENAAWNLIGGTTPAARNVISGNGGWGLGIGYDGATNNIVQGNYIGLAADGLTPLPNYAGVRIVSQSGNVIGGTAPGAGNWITHHTTYGVSLVGDGATNNAILGNQIFANGWRGVDLGEEDVTPNDAGDADGGPNHFQNFPEIASARLASGDLTVRYRVDSATGNSTYPLTVEFFLADSLASGQGRTLIYRHTYDTPQAVTNITFTPIAAVNDGNPIVAAATDANGNTSEFCAPATVTANRRPVVQNPIPDQAGRYGSAFSYVVPANTFSDPDLTDTLSYTAIGLPPGITFAPATRTFGGTPTSSGTFAITVTATDDGVPPLSTNDVFDLVVAKAPLVVTADNKSRLPNQANPPLTGTLIGVTNNDVITTSFQTTATPASPPGYYPITPAISDPNGRLPNYSITTNAGILTVVDCSALAINNATLPNATRGASYNATFTAANGGSPYTFAVTGGALPNNLILASGGLLSGSPTNTGNFAFTITTTDALGCTVNSNYNLSVVCPTLTLSPTTLPNGSKDSTYSATLTTSGGTAPYNYAVTSGVLPGNLALSSGGQLSGTPTNGGTYTFTVQSTDAGGCTASRSYTLTIESLVYEGFAYADGASLAGQNGGSGFSNAWSGASSFTVVPGSFALGGGPTSGGHLGAGQGTVTRRLQAPLGTPGTTRYLSVAVSVVFGGLPNDRFGILLNSTTGTGLFVGKPAAGVTTWSLENEGGGSRVTGPSIAPSSYIVLKCEFFAGNDRFTLYVNPIPGQPEPASGTVKFDSDSGTITNIAFTTSNTSSQDSFDELRLSSTFAGALPSCPAITVNPTSLPNGTLGVPYTQTITASGGATPYTFTSNGGLPPGLNLSANGQISGTPTAGGNYSFSVLARDVNGCTGNRSYSVNVPCPAIALSPGTLPEAVRGVPYSQALSASGGTAPYTFSVAFGALPGGLTLSASGSITGTATNYSVSSFGVSATDAIGCSGLTNYTLEVQPNRWVGDGVANIWNLTAANWRHGLFQNGEDVLFDDTGSNSVPINVSVQVSPASVLVNASQTYVFNGSGGITGTGSVTKVGSGELILAGSNSFSGITRVSAGSLTLRHNQALGTTAGGTVVDGTNAGVHIDGNSLAIAEPLTIDVPDFSDFSATNGALVNLGRTNSWSGPITLTRAGLDGPAAIRSMAGRLMLSSATPIAGPGHLNLGGAGDVVIDSAIGSTVASITAFGPGLARLQGTNACSGGIKALGGKVSAVPRGLGLGPIFCDLQGTFEIDAAGSTPSMNNSVTLNGGKLRVTGGTVTNGGVFVGNFQGGSIETALGSDRLIFTGPIGQFGFSCCGTLTIGGPGTVVLNSGLTPLQNGFIGYWRVNQGTVVANHINALNQAGTVYIDAGGTIRTGVDGGGTFGYWLETANGAFRPGRGTLGSSVSNSFGVLALGQLVVAPGSNLMAGSTADLVCSQVSLLNDALLSVENQNGVNARVTVSAQVLSAPFSLTKAGSGTLVLGGAGLYQGGTIVSNGTLRVANANGSATGPGTLAVYDHATLVGTGKLAGFVTIRSGGTLAPGDSIGTLTISNNLVLEAGSTNSMELNLSPLANDKVIGLSNVTYGGTLRLTRLGATPYATGNAIKLFDAGTYAGSFASIQPATPGSGLQWNTSTLSSDGTLRVSTAVTPVPFALTNISVLPNGSFRLAFLNTPGATFTALATTNIALPLNNWSVLGPAVEVSAGHFQFTDPLATNHTQRFYILRSP